MFIETSKQICLSKRKMTSAKSFVKLSEKFDRVVALIDMDCFYCQVEEKLDKKLENKPVAVVQYLENAGIIAVNYEARARGVTRHMREREAKAVCKDLICVKVPSKNGKADLTKYRDAGYEVAKVLQTFTPLLERASIDEAYLDITESVTEKMLALKNQDFKLSPSNFENTFAVGYSSIGAFVQEVSTSVDSNYDNVPDEERAAIATSKLRLLIGASIINDIRRAVKEKTKYECSAGIAHNKILAKLTCAFHKPNKQTLLPIESIPELFDDLPVNKVKSLGGKLGEEISQKLNVKTMSEILKFSEEELQRQFQNRIGSWLYLMARGIDLEAVTPKFMSKSIAVSKNFRGKNEIASIHTLKFWLKELAKEVVERLAKDEADCSRQAKQMVVSYTQGPANSNSGDTSSSRTVQLNGNSLNSYTAEQISIEAFEVIKKHSTATKFLKAEGSVLMSLNIKHLGIQAGKFEDSSKSAGKNLQDLLRNHQKREQNVPAVRTTSKSDDTTLLTVNENKNQNRPPLPKGIAEIQCAELQKNTELNRLRCTASKTESDVDKIVDSSNDMSSSMQFHGDHAIKGFRTLEHWIKEILREINSRSNKNPKAVSIWIQQNIQGEVQETTQEIPFHNIKDLGSIVAANLKLSQSGKLHPITNIKLCLQCSEEDSLEDAQTTGNCTEASKSSKTENPPPPLSRAETDINSDEGDDEFQNLVNEELKRLNDEEEEQVEEAVSAKERESSIFSNIRDSEEENEIESASVIDWNQQLSPKPCTSKSLISFDKSERSSGLQKQTDESEPSFMSTYAEFQQPENLDLENLNPKEPCPECGKLIRRLEIQFHLDHHLALQIATQQREEYRSQQKPSKMSTKKPLKPKAISKNSNLMLKYVKTIETTATDVSDNVKCEKCYQMIRPEDYVLHLDHHFAQTLREEEMKKRIKVQTATSNASSRNKRQKTDKTKSIKSYFGN